LRKRHRPPHIYQDNTCYFISAGTFHKKRHFDTNAKKKLIKNALTSAINRYEYSLYAWTILGDHYHLLIKTKVGALLPKFIGAIHGKSAIELNKLEQIPGRQIWYQYWDYCIRDKEDFWRHFNYIHHNPVKHGYVKEQSLVADYPFSSYKIWLERKGKEWLNDCLAQYPIIDFTKEEDNF